MDRTKEVELIRRRNAELAQELDSAKESYDRLKNLNSASADKAKSLVEELEEIKAEWLAALDDLHEKQEECSRLLEVLKEMKLIMEEPMEQQKDSWCTRVINKLKNI